MGTSESAPVRRPPAPQNPLEALLDDLRRRSPPSTVDLQYWEPFKRGISDEELRALVATLKTNSTVTHLDLSTRYNFSDEAITDIGAQHLAVLLQTNSRITHLNLCGQRLGDPGVAALAVGLERNSSLTSLDLNQNFSISNRGAERLLAAMDVNRTLIELYGPSWNDFTRKGVDYDMQERLKKAVQRNVDRNNALPCQTVTVECTQRDTGNSVVVCRNLAGTEVATIAIDKSFRLPDLVESISDQTFDPSVEPLKLKLVSLATGQILEETRPLLQQLQIVGES